MRAAGASGTLQPVLDTIRGLKARRIWLEVVTLVIPGFNDSEEELRGIARFLASVDPDIPWHVTAYHQDYKMTDNPNTSARTLLRAYEIGKGEGLRYIYPGNIPGGFGDKEGTHCPTCNALVIGRIGATHASLGAVRYSLFPGPRPGRDSQTTPGRWTWRFWKPSI